MTRAYDLEAVRQTWEGYETPLICGHYPIEHDPIRRYCHMVDDRNPRDIERGECPPVMVDYFASAGPWPSAELDIISLVRRIPTPGDRLVNLGHEFEWFRTARVGDRLGSRHRVVAIEVRPTRLDPLSVWIRTGTTIADGDLLDGFTLPLTMTRMVLQVSGTQDFYPVHHDGAFAREGGHADIFINTGFIQAAFCRLVTDCAVKGRVTRKWRDGARATVDLDVWIENPRDGVATPGSATVYLPSRTA